MCVCVIKIFCVTGDLPFHFQLQVGGEDLSRTSMGQKELVQLAIFGASDRNEYSRRNS